MTRQVASVEHLTLAYGRVKAVEDVSFALSEGELVCLVGRNGSGKSTLMKGMLGLMRPESGAITLEGGPDAVAFLPQIQPGGTDFPATVWEVALSGCQKTGKRSLFYSAEEKDRAKNALASLGIADLAGRRIGELSGGQRQRAFLARCLCRQPRLLLLDEPYAFLDPETAEHLTSILDDLRLSRNIAVFMSSHDLDAVRSCAKRVMVLDRTLLFDGRVEDWLKTLSGRSRHAAPA